MQARAILHTLLPVDSMGVGLRAGRGEPLVSLVKASSISGPSLGVASTAGALRRFPGAPFVALAQTIWAIIHSPAVDLVMGISIMGISITGISITGIFVAISPASSST